MTELYKLRELTDMLQPKKPNGEPPKQRIAYLDDNEMDYEMLSRFMDRSIVDLDYFKSPSEFIEAVEKNSYEMALVDLGMNVQGTHVINLITNPKKLNMKIFLFTGMDFEKAKGIVNLHGSRVNGIISKHDLMEPVDASSKQ